MPNIKITLAFAAFGIFLGTAHAGAGDFSGTGSWRVPNTVPFEPCVWDGCKPWTSYSGVYNGGFGRSVGTAKAHEDRLDFQQGVNARRLRLACQRNPKLRACNGNL